jgi:integrase
MNREASNDGIRKIVLEDGSLRYEARINRRGEKPLSKRFKTKMEAQKWKRSIDSSVDKGKPVMNPKTVLVKQVIDDYLKYRKNSTAPLASNKINEYQRVTLDLGDFAIGKLSRDDVENWLTLLQTKSRGIDKNKLERPPYAKASARKFYYCFKTAVEWHAAKHNYHVNEFMFKLPRGVVPPPWDGRRSRRLKTHEEAALIEAGLDRKDTFTKNDWRSIIGFALATAMREQEIVLARWQDIFQDGQKIHVPKEHCKTKTDRVVLLSGVARKIIAEQMTICPKTESRIFFQFPDPKSVCIAFNRLVKRAKVIDFKFHDLRHEATSRLCEGGKLSIMQLMEMTGHTSMITFKGYLHLLKHENSVVLE